MIFNYDLDQHALLKKIKELFKYDPNSDFSNCESTNIYLNKFVTLYINFKDNHQNFDESKLTFYIYLNEHYHKVNEKMLKDIDDLGETFSKKLLFQANVHLSNMLTDLRKLEIT